MTRTGGALLAAALTMGTLVPAVASGGTAQAGTVSAQALTPSLTLSPQYPLVGSTAKLRATVPTKGQRTVQLQKLVSGSWTKVKSKLSTTTGVAAFSITTPRAVTTYRAFAPKVAAKSLKAVTTPKVVLHPQFPPIPGATKQLAFGEYPFVSSDGSLVTYEGYDDAVPGVSARLHRVSTGTDVTIAGGAYPVISGDGSRVLFSKGGTGFWDESWGLASYDVGSGQTTTIWQQAEEPPSLDVYPGNLSADGSFGALTASDPEVQDGDLGLYLLQGNGRTRIRPADDVESDIAPDGSCIAFDTFDSLVSQDDDGKADAYIWVRATGAFHLVQRAAEANGASYASQRPSVSAGCRFVAWEQKTSLGLQVWRWDRETGKRVMVSHDRAGKSVGENYKPSISANGRYIAFTSSASLTADRDNGNDDLYLWDGSNGGITLLTPTAGAVGAGLHPEISDDGRHVAFDGVPKSCESPCLPRVYLWSRTG